MKNLQTFYQELVYNLTRSFSCWCFVLAGSTSALGWVYCCRPEKTIQSRGLWGAIASVRDERDYNGKVSQTLECHPIARGQSGPASKISPNQFNQQHYKPIWRTYSLLGRTSKPLQAHYTQYNGLSSRHDRNRSRGAAWSAYLLEFRAIMDIRKLYDSACLCLSYPHRWRHLYKKWHCRSTWVDSGLVRSRKSRISGRVCRHRHRNFQGIGSWVTAVTRPSKIFQCNLSQ